MRQNPRPSIRALGLLLLLALSVPAVFIAEAARPGAAATPERASATLEGKDAARVKQNYGSLPLSFEANRGQADGRVRFLARNSAYSLYLADDEMTLALRDTSPREAGQGRTARASVLRIKLAGANRRPRVNGLDELEGQSNYLVGSDPSRWRTDVPNYARVKYEGVYPGVDVVYYGNQRQLEYDFHVAAGADAGRIALNVEGAKGMRVEDDGDLLLPTAAGEVRQHAPHAFQEVGGVRRTIPCRYVLRGATRVGFELGAYDHALPLVIDPVLSYSTLLGGSGYDEGASVAVDAQGNAYVTGFTLSVDFPTTPNPLQTSRVIPSVSEDAFVTKLNAAGTALVYSTFLGGGSGERATSIAVDAAGQAHVAGETRSTNFPVTTGAYRTTGGPGTDLFVSKLNAAGSALLYSTYLGGSGPEYGPRLALGAGGEIYVAGQTHSANFPVTPGAFQTQPRGVSDSISEGFVTKLSPAAGAALLFSTYLGGAQYDQVDGVAVASALDGSVYVTGRTSSHDFPVTPGALQTAPNGDIASFEAFVTRLNSSGTQAVFSTLLGGTGYDHATAVAVDGVGAAYVTGLTTSHDFGATPGAFQTSYVGGPAGGMDYDVFVAKLTPDGASLAYSTYFGGNGGDRPNAVAVDAAGNAYVAGETGSTDLPGAVNGWQTTHGGGTFDGFFCKLDAAGAAVPYATYLGGNEWDQVRGLAVDAAGDVYLTGVTYSSEFYVKPDAVQTYRRGYSDAFITKIALGVEDFSVSGRVTNQYGNGLADVEISVGGTVARIVYTDADGHYLVNGLPPGSEVTITARRFDFFFEPQGTTLSNLSQDETVNFSGPAPLLIRGHVLLESSGSALIQLPVTISGAVNETVYTDWDGYYVFSVPSGGAYTVTPAPDPEFTYEPPSRSTPELNGDQTFDFTALRPARIDGRIYDTQYGYGIGNVTVTLSGPALPQPLVTSADPSGFFSFENLERGATYTVTPGPDTEMNRSFSPAQQTVTVAGGLQFVEFGMLPALSIHGRVADANGNGVACLATLSGSVNDEVQVDEWGFFDFMNLPRGGDYTVTITKLGSLYTFSPPSRSATNLQEMQFFDFEALPPVRIMGHIGRADGNGGLPATVTLGGAVSRTTQADEYGFYEFADLPRGGDYTVTPSYPLFTFTPESRSVTNAQENMTFLSFEALPPLRIFGGVVGEDGLGIAGATVTLSGAVNATAVTDEGGIYQFLDLPRGGNYTVSPAHDLYTFAPPSREFVALADNQVAGFDGALRRFTLSGRAADSGGAPLSGVTVALGGGSNLMRQTDADGNYAFNNLAVGRAYTVTAERTGYSFAPALASVNDPRADQTVNFTGAHLNYTITGRVTDGAAGVGVAGATVSLSGSLAATTQTDAQGNYVFAGLPSEGNYTVTPAHPNFNFAPASRPFTNLLADMTADFAGTRVNYQIGGRVADASGVALAGVTVTLGGACSSTTQTDSLGRYLFNDLPSGFDYTVTVEKTHYTFTPPSRQLDDLGADTAADFTATLLRHNITGRVVDAGGNGFAGVNVQLIGASSAVVTTDANGNYAFNNLPAGQGYTVEPSRQFYDFSPVRGIFNDLGADQTANFTATLRAYNIGGRVVEGATGLAGITVHLTGSQTATTQTDASGNFLFAALPANGNYTVTPAATAVYFFSPMNFNTLPFHQTVNLAGTRLNYQISGAALDACGRPLAGVTMSLARSGQTLTAQTNASGLYSFMGVTAGYNYTLAPTGSTHTFTPPSFVFNALAANQTANFTGRPPTATADVLPLADLYVRGGSASTNFGTATQLIARLASQTKDTHETYVRFNVGQPCTVASVKLRLNGKLSSTGTLTVGVYGVASTTWTETGTTWNNKPAAGALLRTANVSGTTAAWYEWDVTDYVRSELAAGRSTVSFVLKGTAVTGTQATFNSREATGSNGPRLAVTTP